MYSYHTVKNMGLLFLIVSDMPGGSVTCKQSVRPYEAVKRCICLGWQCSALFEDTRVGTLIVVTIYLQLIKN